MTCKGKIKAKALPMSSKSCFMANPFMKGIAGFLKRISTIAMAERSGGIAAKNDLKAFTGK